MPAVVVASTGFLSSAKRTALTDGDKPRRRARRRIQANRSARPLGTLVVHSPGMVVITTNAEGNEERRVEVDGHRFVLVKNELLGEWSVYWDGDRPDRCHPELGKLTCLYVPGPNPTIEVSIGDVDQVDRPKKQELLARVAVAAGLTQRPIPRHIEKSPPQA
jgi:hypothetical protein